MFIICFVDDILSRYPQYRKNKSFANVCTVRAVNKHAFPRAEFSFG